MISWDMVERGDHVKDAVRLLEKALAAEPDSAEILGTLGWANVKLKRFTIAEPQLKQAADRRPDDPDVLEHLGELYAATGRPDAAVHVRDGTQTRDRRRAAKAPVGPTQTTEIARNHKTPPSPWNENVWFVDTKLRIT